MTRDRRPSGGLGPLPGAADRSRPHPRHAPGRGRGGGVRLPSLPPPAPREVPARARQARARPAAARGGLRAVPLPLQPARRGEDRVRAGVRSQGVGALPAAALDLVRRGDLRHPEPRERGHAARLARPQRGDPRQPAAGLRLHRPDGGRRPGPRGLLPRARPGPRARRPRALRPRASACPRSIRPAPRASIPRSGRPSASTRWSRGTRWSTCAPPCRWCSSCWGPPTRARCSATRPGSSACSTTTRRWRSSGSRARGPSPSPATWPRSRHAQGEEVAVEAGPGGASRAPARLAPRAWPRPARPRRLRGLVRALARRARGPRPATPARGDPGAGWRRPLPDRPVAGLAVMQP